jgi:hypothetical protein
VQISTYQHRVPRFKTEIAVQRACQPTHSDYRGRDQHGADRNLNRQQYVSGSRPLPNSAGRSRLDDLIGIRAEYLAYGDRSKEESAD